VSGWLIKNANFEIFKYNTSKRSNMKHNLKRHEVIGLLMIFAAATSFGIGLYITFWAAIRPIFYNSVEYLLSSKEFILFPVFYGSAGLLWVLGKIELKGTIPGKKR
tara:strand:- start:4550 stop:4867 length:318 start_codon:yes stop_codon:yes gene_type:complete